jgi:hypothetical protein
MIQYIWFDSVAYQICMIQYIWFGSEANQLYDTIYLVWFRGQPAVGYNIFGLVQGPTSCMMQCILFGSGANQLYDTIYLVYGTAESRTFYRTPAGYTVEKKTRRKRNRGCQELLSVSHQPLPPPLSPTLRACCTAWGCVIRIN